VTSGEAAFDSLNTTKDHSLTRTAVGQLRLAIPAPSEVRSG
jgi:hypothetical protein